MTDNIYRKLSEERKRLQAEGLVPEWYSTAGFQLFKERYEYDTNGRSVRGQYERIARTAAKHLKGTKFEAEAEQKFFNLFWNKLLSASTPVMANMGTDRGMPVSCFVAGTQVNLENGNTKSIEKLEIGDKVLTHTGKYQKVIATMERESDDLYELEFKGEVFHVTGNHLILTKDHDWVRVDELDSSIHEIQCIP